MSLSVLSGAYERLSEEINRKDKDGDYIFSVEYRTKRQAELDEIKLNMAKYRISENGDIQDIGNIKVDTNKYIISEDGTITAKDIENAEKPIGDDNIAPIN